MAGTRVIHIVRFSRVFFFLFRRRRRLIVYICYLVHVTLMAARVVHGKCFLDVEKMFGDFIKNTDNLRS